MKKFSLSILGYALMACSFLNSLTSQNLAEPWQDCDPSDQQSFSFENSSAIPCNDFQGGFVQEGEFQQNAIDNCCEPVCCVNSCLSDWGAWNSPGAIYLEYTGGRGISYEHGYGALGLFLAPFKQNGSNFQPFFDGKFYYFGKNKYGGSAGLGVRYLPDAWDRTFGLNVYYDNRRTHGHVFNQIGVGLESLGPCWDFRVNGYFPVDSDKNHEVLFHVSGDYFAANRHRVSAWTGVDAEIGTWLFKRTDCSPLNLYFAAGPYYYFREHEGHWRERKHQTAGGRVRLSALITDYIDVSVSATYDSIWHTRVQGQIALVIPFDIGCSANDSCCCNPSPCCRQIDWQPVQRNGIIVVDSECNWKWNWSGGCESGSSGSRSSESCGCRDYYNSGYSSSCPRGRSFHSSEFSSSFFESHSSCSDCSSR